jgi:plasmid stabilization system protein ParE
MMEAYDLGLGKKKLNELSSATQNDLRTIAHHLRENTNPSQDKLELSVS